MNLLAVDIGGTKTLLGIYTFRKGIKQIHKALYQSKEWKSFYLILNDFLRKLPSDIKEPEYGCIGLAGPIVDSKVKLTNLNWVIDKKQILEGFKCNKIVLINDFSSVIYAIPFLGQQQFTCIQEGKGSSSNSKNTSLYAAIGAGTGLGMARGRVSKNKIEVFPSEGGHREFAPRDDSEWDLCQWLKHDLKLNRLSLERIVSGTGLGNIARWRLSKEDAKDHLLFNMFDDKGELSICQDLPKQVSVLAKNGDPLMREVLEMWLSAYGSAVGDLALNELCIAGLWIAGGTAHKHLAGIQSNTFLKSFKNKGRFSHLLEKIPLMVLIDPEIGLFGAACKAHLISSNKTIECQNYMNS